MKRAARILPLVFFFTALLFSPALAKPVRIGDIGRSGYRLPLWVAEDRGLFKKYGLDIEHISFQASPILVASLIAGEIQFSDGGSIPLINAKTAGAQVVMIAVYVDTIPFTLVASEKIKSASQLKGKRIGVGGLASISEISLRKVLQNLGFDPGKDVEIFGIGGGTPDRFAALKSGRVDATVITPPLTVTARKLGFNAILRFQDAGIKGAFNTIDTTTAYARNNRETVLNLLKGLVEGIAYLYKNKEGSLAVLSKRLRLNDREALEETYDDLLKTLQKMPFATEEGVQMMVDTASRTNPKAQSLKPQDIVDMQYLRELEQSGFFEKVYK